MSEVECLLGYDTDDYEDKKSIADMLEDCLRCEVEDCPVKKSLMRWRLKPL